MPRYFFEVIQDGSVQEDRIGTDLDAAADLQLFAVRRAAEAVLVAAETAPLACWLMQIKDERQVTVGRVSFAASGFGTSNNPH